MHSVFTLLPSAQHRAWHTQALNKTEGRKAQRRTLIENGKFTKTMQNLASSTQPNLRNNSAPKPPAVARSCRRLGSGSHTGSMQVAPASKIKVCMRRGGLWREVEPKWAERTIMRRGPGRDIQGTVEQGDVRG